MIRHDLALSLRYNIRSIIWWVLLMRTLRSHCGDGCCIMGIHAFTLTDSGADGYDSTIILFELCASTISETQKHSQSLSYRPCFVIVNVRYLFIRLYWRWSSYAVTLQTCFSFKVCAKMIDSQFCLSYLSSLNECTNCKFCNQCSQ